MRLENDDYDPFIQESIDQIPNDDFTKWRFDVENQLDALEHNLLGERKYFDKQKKRWIWKCPPGVKPTMTMEGAREMISPCQIFIGKIPSLSILTENEIRDDLRNIQQGIVDMLFDNWERWRIEKGKLDITVTKITRFIRLSLKQALNAKTLESLYKMEQIKRVYTEGKKDEGIKISPFGGRDDKSV